MQGNRACETDVGPRLGRVLQVGPEAGEEVSQEIRVSLQLIYQHCLELGRVRHLRRAVKVIHDSPTTAEDSAKDILVTDKPGVRDASLRVPRPSGNGRSQELVLCRGQECEESWVDKHTLRMRRQLNQARFRLRRWAREVIKLTIAC